jgi:hypothetical protein
MGFMDKAKKIAEQAQQKLDEAQKNFNQGGSTPGQPGAGGGARYDQHGRPLQDAPPAGTTPPPSGEPAPAAGADTPEPAAPEPDPAPPAPPSQASGSSPNATPDPFKPLDR